MNSTPFIEMKSIRKIYPDGTEALKGVDFELRRGEIVGLLGENGAGKTTLMKILSGLLPPTGGEIYVDGKRVRFRNPSDALRAGIGMVHQYFALVPPFTAVENILLGQEGAGDLSLLDLNKVRAKLSALAEETGLKVPFDTPIELLSAGVQQRVEILKVLYRGTDVLILDEPTSYLTPLEVEELFKIMRNLKEKGKAIVFITHKLREVLEISDRIQVLRNGEVTGKISTEEATPKKLAIMMVGKEVVPRVTRKEMEPGEPVLRVKNLKVMSDFNTLAVKGLSFEVRAGEIFGIAGVEGNGQSELVQAITGLRKPLEGEVWLKDTNVTGLGPKELYGMGLSHIPEDKTRFGLAMNFDLAENSILGRQWEPQFLQQLGRLNWNRIADFARYIIKTFNVVAPGIRTPVKSLSGGNQQRLLVGRELSKEPVLVVAAHPTRGLDIASTVYIRELLIRMRDEGKGVLLVSADLDEILELSDRIAVMYEGEFLGVGKAEELTREEIGLMMGGIRP
ncbi:MAG TPA: ABC transporter ATP-binding protein [Chloroflexi bacterium]|nr:ABC transporter ATP-binding protein [Chloroflexota bacterium]